MEKKRIRVGDGERARPRSMERTRANPPQPSAPASSHHEFHRQCTQIEGNKGKAMQQAEKGAKGSEAEGDKAGRGRGRLHAFLPHTLLQIRRAWSPSCLPPASSPNHGVIAATLGPLNHFLHRKGGLKKYEDEGRGKEGKL